MLPLASFPFLMSYIILYRTTADLHALPSCKISFQVHTIILQQLTVSASSAILSHGHCIAHSFIKCHSQSTDKSKHRASRDPDIALEV